MVEDTFKVDIRPDVAALRIFRSMSFTPWYALGEFVDNSITSSIKSLPSLKKLNGSDYELQISIDFDKTNDTLVVEDNAAGISRSEIERALKTGIPPADTSIGLSKHGVGMKAAKFLLNIFGVKHHSLKRSLQLELTCHQFTAHTLTLS
jgi:hypothetical protein